MLKPYSDAHEQQMRVFCKSLSEKDKRRYATLKARKLPYCGISYLCRALGGDQKTIDRGLAELDGLEGMSLGDLIRKAGAGRKRALETIAEIDEVFLMILEHYTAGNRCKRGFAGRT
jgi:hypothetical protein